MTVIWLKQHSIIHTLLCLALALLMLSACRAPEGIMDALKDPLDPSLRLSYSDYENALRSNQQSAEQRKQAFADNIPPIPAMAPIIAPPPPPEIGSEKLVSMAVTEDVPIKDVLLELARLAEVDIEIDPNIKGGVIFRVKNKPLNEVFERISNLAKLRITKEQGMIRVEQDLPYVVNYPVDFLNLTRSNEGSVEITTKVLGSSGSGGDGGSEGGLDSGSTNALTSSYESDLWDSVEKGINSILTDQSSAEEAFASSLGATSATGEVNLGTSNNGSDTSSTGIQDSFSVLNKQAGVITIRTTGAKHKEIKQFIQHIKKSASAQVLIEAKIVEVNLDEEHRTGVNWDFITRSTGGFRANGTFTDATATATSGILSLSILDKTGNNIETAIDLVEKFGASRTLSSPRLHAMNNQQSVLTFAENQVYFTLDIEREEQQDDSGNDTTTLSFESELHTVPIGVVLTLQPSINLETNEIMMNIRPTVSRITGTVSDPAVTLVASQDNLNVQSQIPVVEVRELDSVLKIQSGQVMVIGGLMQENVDNEDTGVPVLGRIPWLGKAFKSSKKTKEVIETIIFIRATIVPSFGVSDEDKQFYKTFTSERRSLKL